MGERTYTLAQDRAKSRAIDLPHPSKGGAQQSMVRSNGKELKIKNEELRIDGSTYGILGTDSVL